MCRERDIIYIYIYIYMCVYICIGGPCRGRGRPARRSRRPRGGRAPMLYYVLGYHTYHIIYSLVEAL